MSPFTFAPLSYGTASLGNLFHEVSEEAAFEALETAWECGMRYFDTAPHYGLGLAEKRLGQFLATKPRTEYLVSTKVGRLLHGSPETANETDIENGFFVKATHRRVADFSESGIRKSVEDSLERMNIDAFDILFLHDPERYGLTNCLDTGLPALHALKSEGLVSGIGIGSMSEEALYRSITESDLDVLMIAGQFTLLEPAALKRILPECILRGVEVVNASVFNSGLLGKKTPTRSDHYDYGTVPEQLLDKALMISQLCEEFDVELPTAALQYTMRHPAVKTIVLGGAKSSQLRDCSERITIPVPAELWSRLAAEKLIP